MYIHVLYILNICECVTVLLVDKTTIVIIYKDFLKDSDNGMSHTFITTMSQWAEDHMIISKGKAQNTS